MKIVVYKSQLKYVVCEAKVNSWLILLEQLYSYFQQFPNPEGYFLPDLASGKGPGSVCKLNKSDSLTNTHAKTGAQQKRTLFRNKRKEDKNSLRKIQTSGNMHLDTFVWAPDSENQVSTQRAGLLL